MKKTKRLIITFFWVLFLIGCNRLSHQAGLSSRNLIPLVKKVQPAVVTIITYDMNQNAMDLGSGFFIDPKGYLVTNFHVLGGAYSAVVKTNDGGLYPIEAIVAENETADLIKVRVKLDGEKIKWVSITDEEPVIAERIMVVGSPLGLEQTVSEGIISAVREIPLVGKIFQLSAPISPGSSGSPVINMNGKVLGVVSFQATKGQNLNFAVSGKAVLELKQKAEPQSVSEWTYDIQKRTPKIAEELCKKGFSFSIKGEFKNALNYYQEATEKSPDDSVAWYGLGSCYDGLKQPEKAIAAYKQVIRINPKNPDSHYHLGRYYLKLERYQEAIQAYNQAISIDPDYIAAHFDLGVVYGEMKAYEKGERAFQQVLRIHPGHVSTHYFMGLIYNRMGRNEDAVRSYQNALIINPNSAMVLYGLGVAYGDMGKQQEETEAFKQAIRIDPDFAPAHYKMGLYYLNTGNRAAALEEYKLLKRLNSETAEELFNQIYR